MVNEDDTEIVKALRRRRECTTNDLAVITGFPASYVISRLRQLRAKGFVDFSVRKTIHIWVLSERLLAAEKAARAANG